MVKILLQTVKNNMTLEFTPQDFENFKSNPRTMDQYQECAKSCLLFNFGGAISPVIQEVVADAQAGIFGGPDQVAECHSNTMESHHCQHCALSPREHQMAVLLLIDALL